MIWRSLLVFALTFGAAVGFVLVTNKSHSDTDGPTASVSGTRQVTLAIYGMT
jgi:hypothetical protein